MVTGALKRTLFYGVSLYNISFLPQDVLRRNLSFIVSGEKQFSDCVIPFCCTATDLIQGDSVVFTEGRLLDAIVASSSIPGIFPPVEMDGKKLIDGSWTVQNPVRFVRQMGADFVIAVDLTQMEKPDMEMNNSLDVLMNGSAATIRALAMAEARTADFVVQPDICEIHWADFSQGIRCVEDGREATEKLMPGLKKQLSRARWRKMFTGRTPNPTG